MLDPLRPEPLSLTSDKLTYSMKAQLLSLLGKQHPLRILLLLRREGPKRFSEVEEATGLNPAQVDRSLKLLREGMWVVPETVAEEDGPVHIHYRVGQRGKALLQAVDAFRESLDQHRSAVGDEAVDEVEALYA